ncbi:MAG: sulfur carrier protein ThiS [Acidobacteriaceae bacterium]|nr:sulfur carrier protein ThiS [Acidobacteriaceae bacterium]
MSGFYSSDLCAPRGPSLSLPSVPCDNLLVKLQINGESRDFTSSLTLAALVDQLGMKSDRVAIELNREIVPRDSWTVTNLSEGDRLEIVHFVGGGTSH